MSAKPAPPPHALPPPRRTVSLADVAALAGVSTGTVSRALSRPAMVQAATRARVLDAAAQLGYVVNGMARALVSRTTRTVGAIVPRFGTSSFASMLQALEATLSRSGYTVLIAAPDHRESDELLILRKLLERGIDAVGLLGGTHAPEVYALLAQHRVPFVLMWAQDVPDAACVGFDEAQAGELLIEHLAALGHRRVGFISGRMADNDRARQRLQGVIEALAQRGMELPPTARIETEYGFPEGHDAMRRILRAQDRVTAVICGNDYLAAGALAACLGAGLAIPRDISVASFNDNDFAAYLNPALTTVRLPIVRIGELAGRCLIDQLAGRQPRIEAALPVELMVRASTGPAPARAPMS